MKGLDQRRVGPGRTATIDGMEEWVTELGVHILDVAIIVAAAVVGAVIVGAIIRRLGRRVLWMARLSHHARTPFRLLVASIAGAVGIHVNEPVVGGWPIAGRIAALCVIGTAAWLLGALLFVLEESALPRLRTDVEDNRHARAVRTQVMVLRRVTVAVVAILAVGAALTTFREVRLLGTSVIASAGVIAAIAAFATNALLGNVIAGLQIAFSGSLRLDDVVVVEEEWGRVEEITLTYVVVHIWDDRRLILPTSYFTTQVFENWTHTASQLIGEVLLDVDWSIDVDGLRGALRELVEETPLWDGRVAVAQVVDAVGGEVTIRALVSARDAGTLWDLRCLVREGLVKWVRDSGAPPRTRAEVRTDLPELKLTHHVVPSAGAEGVFDGTATAGGTPERRSRDGFGEPRSDRVFSGDRESRARGQSFSGPPESERRDPTNPAGDAPEHTVDTRPEPRQD
jgi:small-conductance mechanosensitive channel